MKNVLHLQGTTLKPGQSKNTSIQHDTKGVSGINLEAHPVQVKDWSQCTKEQVAVSYTHLRAHETRRHL
eukprot:12791153-Prorocentrum_lima.AAC.1